MSAKKRRHQRVSLDFFLDLSVFTNPVTQIVKLRTANLTVSYYFNSLNVGGVNGEGLFGAYAVGNTSYGEGLGNTAVLSGDDRSFKNLGSDSLTLDDSLMNLNGVTYVKFGDLGFKLLICKCLNDIQSVYLRFSSSVRAELQRTARVLSVDYTIQKSKNQEFFKIFGIFLIFSISCISRFQKAQSIAVNVGALRARRNKLSAL